MHLAAVQPGIVQGLNLLAKYDVSQRQMSLCASWLMGYVPETAKAAHASLAGRLSLHCGGCSAWKRCRYEPRASKASRVQQNMLQADSCWYDQRQQLGGHAHAKFGCLWEDVKGLAVPA